MNKKALVVGAWFWCILALIMATTPLLAAETTPASSPKTPAAFRVLDISERTYDNGPALAVVFSQPLDSKVRHDEFVRVSDEKEILKSAWVLSQDQRVLYYPNALPQTKYSVTVLEAIQSAAGQPLDQRYSKTITTRKINPGVNFASDGLILPQKMTEGLPVATINVPVVEIEFFRLNDSGIRNFINWENLSARQDYEALRKIPNYGELVFSGRFNLEPPANKRVIRHVPIMNIENLQKPGVYFGVMRRPGEYGHDYQATYFLVTDIGLHARVYSKEALILASSLKTGQPLPGVKVTLYDKKAKPVKDGITDAEGKFAWPEGINSKEISFARAELDNQITILPFDVPALDMSEFEFHGRGQQPREIFVYSPRDIYRPGETVVISAILRDYDGRTTKTLPLLATLHRPDGRKVRTFTWQPQDGLAGQLGYYQTEINLPQEGQTGDWRLELRDNPKAPAMRVFTFQVEDFLPERMKLDLTTKQDILKADQDWNINLTGMYLYGAPAAGNRLEAKVRVKAKRLLFDQLDGFQFGELADQNYNDSWDLPDQELGDSGHGSLVVEEKWKDLHSPVAVRVIASLFESGGRPVTRGIERVYWPAETLIGVRPLFKGTWVDQGGVNFELVKVGPGGSLLPAQGLLLTLTKEERDYYWEYSENRGWEHKFTEKKYDVFTDQVNLDGTKPAKTTFQLQNGRYVLAVQDPATNVTTSMRFDVGRWWYGRGDRAAAHPDRVELNLDKTSYKPGDLVKVTITPPHAGPACLMVEGQTILWAKRLDVPAKGITVEIPVPASWDSHDLYVSAVIFRPGEAQEKITPNRALGLVHLPLDRSDREMNLTIEAPEKVIPIGPAPMTTKLKLGQKPTGPVMVTLAAVDVGILSLTDFQTPNPVDWFFQKRRYGVDLYDIYGKVVENLAGAPAKLACGGDADQAGGGKGPQSKVKLVSLFQSPVSFDQNGEAQVTMTVPGDFNGRLRLMAIAFSGNTYASAEKEVTVAAPVVTQLSTPRYLAPGDESEFSLDVHNLSGQTQKLKLTLTANHPLVVENGQQTVELNDQQKKIIKFPVKARNDYAGSTIRLKVEGPGLVLESDQQLGVRPGYPGTARKVRRILKKGEMFVLDKNLIADLMPSSVDVDLKFSSVIPLNLKQAMQDLITYPHGCLEQTTSRAYPLLFATGEAIDKFGLPFIDHQSRVERLNQAIERLGLMQQSKGGFGLWYDYHPEEQWLTCYTTEFLLLARDRGLNVPGGMLENALKRLDFFVNRKMPEGQDKKDMDPVDFAVRAYAGYVLAKVERAPLGALRTLYDNHRDRAISSLPLAHLGLALKMMGDTVRSGQALKAAATKRRTDRYFWGDYGSPIRDLALTAALFLEHKIEAVGWEKLLLDLEDQLRQRQWLSTQEKYAVFKVGLALETTADQEWTGQLLVAGKATQVKRRNALALSPTLAEVNGGVMLRSDYQKPLYVSAVVSGYPKTPPAKDDSRLVLERELYDLTGKKVDKSEFKVGDLLLVHLTIHSKELLQDALLVDLLPAGLEIENPNLKYSVKLDDTKFEDLSINDQAIWKLQEDAHIVHEEYRDDRYVAVMELQPNYDYHRFYLVRAVSPGSFAVPPVFVESMYRPEVRGVSLTPKKITVVNKK